MKKKVVSVLLVMAMAGTVLAGCGGSSDESQNSSDGDSPEEKGVVKIGIRADMVDQLEAVRDEIEGLGYTTKRF